ncbi:MAG: serine hydrolase [Planctomycetota bacterium]
MDDVASSMLKEQHLPGLALVVVQDGKTILKRGFGLANIEKQTKVDPNKSLFRIGSVSKALTFLALTRLLDQGKLKRSDKIDPFVANVLNPCGFSSEITINHLLTHTAGFDQVGTGRHVYDHHLTLAERKAKRVGLDIFLKSGNLRRVTDAGEMFRYDTYGVTLAGSIIEQVTGLSYAEAMQQELFEPLGMHNSFVEVDGANLKHLALGYGWQQGQYQPRPYEVYVTTPASSIDMTPNDMGLLLEAITRDGSNDAGRLLTTSMMNRVLAPHFRAAPEFHGITHGFFESHTSLESNTQVHLRSIGHGGSMDGYRCALTIVPERKLGIFFVANRAPESGGGVVDFRPLLDLIFNQLKDAPKRKDFAIPSPATFSVPQDKLTEFIGNYYYGTFCHTPSRQDIAAGAWPRPDAISIVVLGKGLKIGEEDYRPYSEDTFVRSDGERLVRFGRNGDSVITNFVYSTSPDTFEKEMPNLPYPKRRSLAQSLLELANQQNSESTLEFLERNKASEEYYVREAEFNRLGYLLMEQGELDLAIEVFKVNSEEFPNSWNAFDSLAEGYAKLGKKELSILNYRKSLELNPRNEAGRQMLNKLRRE